MSYDLPSLGWLLAQPWTIPVIGVAAAGVAFLVGRVLFARAARAPAPPAKADAGPPVDVFVHGSSQERRATPRRRGNSVEVFLADSPDKSPVHGWVVDRSVGGLCLLVDKPVPEGAVLQVRPRTAPEATPWTAVEIRSCRAENGEWEVGCQFVKSPQWNVLLLFG
jgi:hypothetical protein